MTMQNEAGKACVYDLKGGIMMKDTEALIFELKLHVNVKS